MPLFSFASLRVRLALFVLFSSIPAFVMVFYMASQRRRHETGEAQQSALSAAKLLAMNQARMFDGVQQLLHTLSHIPEVQRRDAADCTGLLSELGKALSGYTGLYALAPDGTVFASSSQLASPLHMADRPWFQRVLASRALVMGSYEIGALGGKPAIAFARPAFDGTSGEIAAIVVGEVDLRWLNEVLAAAKLPPSTTVTITDASGTILVRYPDPERWVGKRHPNAPALSGIGGEVEGTAEGIGLDGVRRLYGFAQAEPAPGSRLRVQVGIPKAVALAEASRLLRRDLAALGLGLLLAIVAASLGGDLLFRRPIRVFLDAIKRIEAGDMSARAGLRGSEEIDRLGRSFNQMLAAVEQRELQIREAEARYRNLVEQIPAITYTISIERPGKVLYLSPQFETLLGYSRDDWLTGAASWIDLVYPEDRAHVLAEVDRCRSEGRPLLSEHRLRARDGHAIWVLARVDVVRDPSGRSLFLQGVSFDITERKQAEEEALKRNRDLSILYQIDCAIGRSLDLDRLLADALSATIEALDAAAGSVSLLDPGGTMLRMRTQKGLSEAAAESLSVLGVEEGLSGRAVQAKQPVVADVADMTRGRLAELFEHEGFGTLVSVPLLSGGEVMGALNLATRGVRAIRTEQLELLRSIGTQLGVAVRNAQLYGSVQRELEERRAAEKEKEALWAQLVQAQRMEAVGILAGGIAHDFNNLLTTIQGYSELAMMETDPESRFHDDLAQIQAAAVRAAALTRQLLLFSRRQPMNFGPLNINTTISEMLMMLGRLIGEDIVIETALEKELWNIRGDAGSVEQVIMNLAVNSRDAMPAGGRITISTANATVDERACEGVPDARPGRYVVVSVADTGVGMDEATLRKIFEPFFTTKEVGKGTGLGLSVVYGIVRGHGGWIRVTSRPGQGTAFTIYVPADTRAVESKEGRAAGEQPLKGRGERVLLVEDEDGVRGFVSRVLQQNGYVVLTAEGVRDATSLFQREGGGVDVVVSDVVLPDGSGLDLVAWILERDAKLRVLLTSGYSDHKSQWSLIRDRRYPFLQKPYSVPGLLRALRRAIESEPGAVEDEPPETP